MPVSDPSAFAVRRYGLELHEQFISACTEEFGAPAGSVTCLHLLVRDVRTSVRMQVLVRTNLPGLRSTELDERVKGEGERTSEKNEQLNVFNTVVPYTITIEEAWTRCAHHRTD